MIVRYILEHTGENTLFDKDVRILTRGTYRSAYLVVAFVGGLMSSIIMFQSKELLTVQAADYR